MSIVHIFPHKHNKKTDPSGSVWSEASGSRSVRKPKEMRGNSGFCFSTLLGVELLSVKGWAYFFWKYHLIFSTRSQIWIVFSFPIFCALCGRLSADGISPFSDFLNNSRQYFCQNLTHNDRNISLILQILPFIFRIIVTEKVGDSLDDV